LPTELSVFDLSFTKLLVLAVIALVIFGPNELPKIVSQAGRALRDLRRIAEGAKNDLREGMGPEFADFDIDDLNPKRFVQKHLFDDLNGDATVAANPRAPMAAARSPRAGGVPLAPGERPPYDPDAT
jgi:sec-independent protein translocase protein TatB